MYSFMNISIDSNTPGSTALISSTHKFRCFDLCTELNLFNTQVLIILLHKNSLMTIEVVYVFEYFRLYYCVIKICLTLFINSYKILYYFIKNALKQTAKFS